MQTNFIIVQFFDYTVNSLHKPIDLGDVFKVVDKYFILLGQECDLRLRSNGVRKTEIFELVKADVEDKITECENSHGFEQAVISNFLDDTHNMKLLKIDCGKRFYAKTEIFDMCVFNENGLSKIDLKNPLPLQIKVLLPSGYDKLYLLLQEKYNDYNLVRKNYSSENIDEILNFVGLTNVNNQVVNFNEYTVDEKDFLSYKVQRVCRLRKHAHVLHSLYLNYRGRQAEDAIYFSRYYDAKYSLGDTEYDVKILLSSKDAENVKNRAVKSPWRVSKKDLNSFLENAGMKKICYDGEDIYLKQKECELDGYKIIKGYNESTDKLYLDIHK